MNSIDNLKATLSKKGGVAFANRFQVFFTPPTATLSALASKDVGSLLGSLVSGGSIKNLIPDPIYLFFVNQLLSQEETLTL